MPRIMVIETLICLVVGISDGDTLTARCGREGAYYQTKVRLAEIDAPEKGQPFGERARLALGELCFGQQVRIEVRDRDRYGRLVARVKCKNKSIDASEKQVRSGMAWVYDKYVTDQRLYRHQDEARAARRGLWIDLGAKQAPVPPWEWRAAKRGAKNADRR